MVNANKTWYSLLNFADEREKECAGLQEALFLKRYNFFYLIPYLSPIYKKPHYRKKEAMNASHDTLPLSRCLREVFDSNIGFS